MPTDSARKNEEAQKEDTAAKKASTLASPRDPELPPLQEWIDNQYKDLKKDFHETREKILESQPDREPYMPYCFNSLLAYTNTDVPHYCLYKRYEENPAAYCQRRTAIRLTEPEVSWAMDNVLFLSDYEMYYKPIVPVETAEEQQKGEEEGEEGEEGAEDGEGEGADGEEGATQKQKKKQPAKKDGKQTQKTKQKPKESESKDKEQPDEGEEEEKAEKEVDEQKEQKEKEEEKKRRKQRDEQTYQRAKEVWVTSSFDYIFEKPDRTQKSLLAALRQNRRFLKDIKQSIWDRLVKDREDAYNKMVKWKKEQEEILRNGKPAEKPEEKEEDEEKEENAEQTEAEQE